MPSAAEFASRDTILIVDDMPFNLKLLLTHLERAGFMVKTAHSGAEALRQVQQQAPDLILLDIMMPDMDGFEVCERLKSDALNADIPIIFITALGDTHNKIKAFKRGAVDYVTKPIQAEEVLARIRTHLELHRLNLLLEERNKELQRQNEELDAFSHTVAHDLKNPLNIITTASSMLLELYTSEISEEAAESVEDIHHSAVKIESIITSLLSLAGIRKATVKMEVLDMAVITAQARQNLSYLFKEYAAELDVCAAWPRAVGYAPWIEEVWVNYLSNAVKYGGSPPRLRIGADASRNGYVRFWVSDNGAGLSEEEQAGLFAPFTRIQQAGTKGHGLGLSIVQRIIERCGGKTGINSRPGEGSTFYFLLPAADDV